MPRINVRNLKYHKIIGTTSDGLPIYAMPLSVGPTAVIAVEKIGESSSYYADGEAIITLSRGSGFTVTLTLANIPEQFAIDCLGNKKDENGVWVETQSDKKSEFALTGEIEEAFEGSLINPFKFVYFKCTADVGAENAETDRDTTTFSEETLVITTKSIPVNDENITRSKLYKYSDEAATIINTNYSTFDNSIYIPVVEQSVPPTITIIDPSITGYVVNTLTKEVVVDLNVDPVADIKDFINATDYASVDITDNVVVSGTVDTANIGEYIVLYTVQDDKRQYAYTEIKFIVA